VKARVAVVGHVEWVTHARGAMPRAGEIAHLSDQFDEAGGGGAVAATQVAALGAECLFFTALGGDGAGDLAAVGLRERGIVLHAARHAAPQTRALSATGDDGDRAIAVIGDALWPRHDDDLPWPELDRCDAVYFTGRDPATLSAARAAGALVVTARRAAVLAEAGVRADVVVASATDPAELIGQGDLPLGPAAIVWTEGARGGRYLTAEGREGRWAAHPPPAPVVDTYGCGDSFAAGLTVGLARGFGLDDAIALGARCGARCAAGRGALGFRPTAPQP
jgi:ribokinase